MLRPKCYEGVGSVKTWERMSLTEGAVRAQVGCVSEGERETVAENGERVQTTCSFKGHFKELLFLCNCTVP